MRKSEAVLSSSAEQGSDSFWCLTLFRFFFWFFFLFGGGAGGRGINFLPLLFPTLDYLILSPNESELVPNTNIGKMLEVFSSLVRMPRINDICVEGFVRGHKDTSE